MENPEALSSLFSSKTRLLTHGLDGADYAAQGPVIDI
jgi:hypothetical protein